MLPGSRSSPFLPDHRQTEGSFPSFGPGKMREFSAPTPSTPVGSCRFEMLRSQSAEVQALLPCRQDTGVRLFLPHQTYTNGTSRSPDSVPHLYTLQNQPERTRDHSPVRSVLFSAFSENGSIFLSTSFRPAPASIFKTLHRKITASTL